ncbi:hypothetical protein [Vibrio alfacsensis]|uniref:hypothetical protein n=1 Tax=Vibrio alfacsensis TaxID=1074311 RepID=UPI0040676C33
MNKNNSSRSKARKGKDYTLDPETRRSRFIKNNTAALVHGGYSKQLPAEVLDAITDNDLGFEIGVLKGQLSNITFIGEQLIGELEQQGDIANALSVVLSCADRAAKLVPQIQKALESPIVTDSNTDVNKLRLKNRWLKKLQNGDCLASEVAYQFEIHQLGHLPLYVIKKLESELKNNAFETDDAPYSREDLQQQLNEYWLTTQDEEENRSLRSIKISKEKKRITDSFFSSATDNAADKHHEETENRSI